MKERIIEFLRKENKSSAQLALEIGVQPSSISHIISGRNNPSLDFVMKMLSRYSTLSADWLLFGRGQMSTEKTISDLFDQSPLLSMAESGIPSESGSADQKITDDGVGRQDETLTDRVPDNIQFSKAKKIICFYENNTFKEYFPAKE